MLPRFYAPDLVAGDAGAVLPAQEAHHLTRVLRLGEGDEIAVFDGRGAEYRARVTAAARDGVQVTLIEPIAPAPEPRVALTLVQAILKGDKMDAVVRDATMMGAVALEPIVTTHGVVRLASVAGGKSAERWRRVAVSSAKQCRRAVVPAIEEPRAFGEALAAARDGLRLLLVEPSADAGEGQSMRSLTGRADRSVALFVGPEGGWTAEEVDGAVASGCVPVTLGRITLRADAVPLAALAVVRFALGDL